MSKYIEIKLKPGTVYQMEEAHALMRQAEVLDLLTPVRDAVSEALDNGADRLALCDALRDLADELDDVTTQATEHGGLRVTVRGDVSMIYGDDERGVSAFPTPRRVRTVFPTRDEAVRSLVRLAAARRGATA